MKSKIKNLLPNLLLMVGGIFFGLFLLEIFLRVVPGILPMNIYVAMNRSSLLQTDPQFGVVVRPNVTTKITGPEYVYTINSVDLKCDNIGFRDDGIQNKKMQILALGDSFTWGVGVESNETWPEVLETAINVDVINAGFIGIGTKQQLNLLKRCGQTFKPNLVIVALFMNDFQNNDEWESKTIDGDSLSKRAMLAIRLWLATHSYSYQLAKYYILAPFGIGEFAVLLPQEEFNEQFKSINQPNLNLMLYKHPNYLKTDFPDKYHPNAITEMEKNMLAIQKEATQLNSDVLFVIIPPKEQVYWSYLENTLVSKGETIYDPNRPSQVFIDIANRNNLLILDTTPILVKQNYQQLYWNIDGHLNAKGYKIVADAINTTLQELALLNER